MGGASLAVSKKNLWAVRDHSSICFHDVFIDDHLTFPCLVLQEKAGADLADTDVSKPQELQFPSLESALKTDWSRLHPRRSHKLICLLAGDPTGTTVALLRHVGLLRSRHEAI